MIVIDANLLIYAYDPASPFHQRARDWLSRQFNGIDAVCIPWLSIWAFVRLSTNSRLAPRSLLVREVFGIVESWLAQDRVIVLQPGPRHTQLLSQLIDEGQAMGPKSTDAVLAALAMEHGATLASSDRDFARFPGLKWINPLSSA